MLPSDRKWVLAYNKSRHKLAWESRETCTICGYLMFEAIDKKYKECEMCANVIKNKQYKIKKGA